MALLGAVATTGCAYVIQPQSFLPPGEDLNQAAVILNNYTDNNFNYFIKRVDGTWVGDKMRGSSRINEIHAVQGRHKLEVVASLSNGSCVHMALADAFIGEIECDLKKNAFYTLDTSQRSMPAINPTPYQKRAMEVHCVEHAIKPENKMVMKDVKEHGWKISPDFFNPKE